MLNLWRCLLCRLFGHKRCFEDLGGVVLECCERCEWAGRHAEYPIEIGADDKEDRS
jgi:hypothetical protein